MIKRILLLSLFFSVASAMAEDDTLKLYTFGNSLTSNVGPGKLEPLAAAGGEKLYWDRSGAPGVPIWSWIPKMEQWKGKFIDQKWDVVTVQPFSSFEREMEAAQTMAEFMQKHQPQAQFYVYAQWPGRRSSNWYVDFAEHKELPSWSKRDEQIDKEWWLELTAEELQQAGVDAKDERSPKNEYELITLALRERVPMEKPIKMIPAGHVMALLGQKMQAGLVPGLSNVHDLYADGVHLNNIGAYTAACTWYATLFGKSPVGLPVGEYQGDKGTTVSSALTISPELAKVIQETAWEVVATHPLTGVQSDLPVKIATPALQAAVVGEPWSATLAPAFGKAPYTWRAIGLPDGVAIEPAGRLIGTPTKAGRFDIQLQVKDASGQTATRALVLVVETDSAPKITTPETLPTRQVGAYFTMNLQTEGGNGAIGWELKRHEKAPPGLRFEKSGSISGAIGAEGVHTFTLIATDSDRGDPESDQRTFTITATPPAADVLIVREITERPDIDGVLDEEFWNLQYPIAKVVEGKPNNKAMFDIVWGHGRLYIAVKVEDDAIHPNRNDLMNGDAVDLFFDTLNNREVVYNFDDKRFLIPVKDGRQHGLKIGLGGLFKGIVKTNETGYVAEYYFNLTSPAGLMISRAIPQPLVIGFDIAIYDDDGSGRDSMLVWRGTAENDTRPDQFGTIILQPRKEKAE